ncbi:MAG TPA: HslU--HslV peptidase ATPase subunit, partial [Candidatus Ornithoclostridium faecavium]|nr:HslU--HslV peptidase ATPase subunit [Candidatus Ornithoclostridium faecavium]
MEKLTPKQIVKELDRYIIGQHNAKKAVAVALRNRYRRSQLPPEVSEEITPKNIIMQGPTGVGKTEIARRLAKLVKAPFVKVEATKYTEVGYVGRDVESMIRDLAEASVRMVRDEMMKDVEIKAKANVYAQLFKAVFPLRKSVYADKSDDEIKEIVRKELESGALDNLTIEIELPESNKPQQLMPGGVEINIGDIMGGILPKRKKLKKVTVARAYSVLMEVEAERLIDQDNVNAEAIRRAENEGIIFIDEMDKIAGKGAGNGPDVSREGVQRDILPIVEGCTVNTKYGQI